MFVTVCMCECVAGRRLHMLLYKRWNAGELGDLLEVWWSVKFNKHSLTWMQFEIVLKTDRT